MLTLCHVVPVLLNMLNWRAAVILCIVALFFLHCQGFEVIEEMDAEISAGESRYYTVETGNTFIIALITDKGDADMYCSYSTKKPSSEDNDYSSTSCGMDLMVIPGEGHTQKVSIAVYGHVRHEHTTYRMYLILPSEEDIRRYQVSVGGCS